MLVENLRWNDQLKLYTAKVFTPEQAVMIREAMKMVAAEDEADLQATAPTDEDISDIFDFPEAKSTDIDMIASIEVDGDEKTAIGGDTYAFKDLIKKAGFEFDGTKMMWLAPVDTDTTELEDTFEEYGFNIEKYDAVAEDEAIEDAGDM